MEQLKQLGGLSRSLLDWMRRQPAQAFLLAGVIATIVYFFGFLRLYANQAQPIWEWAWLRFLPQYNQEHSKIIPLLVLFLVWYHRAEIRAAKREGSNLGLLFVGAVFMIGGDCSGKIQYDNYRVGFGDDAISELGSRQQAMLEFFHVVPCDRAHLSMTLFHVRERRV